MRNFYLVLAIIGTVVPWLFFTPFIAANGLDFIAFGKGLFATQPSSGAVSDALIASFVFWVWSYFDSKKHNVPHWWMVIAGTFLVGISLSMPLYFYFREGVKPTA